MEVIPLENITSESVAFYNNWVSRFGTPYTIVSDQGRQFTSQVFKDLAAIGGTNCNILLLTILKVMLQPLLQLARQNPELKTFLHQTTSPALDRALVASDDRAIPQINPLGLTASPLSHFKVECSVGPTPQAASINIGYAEAWLFNPEEEDIEDYVKELKCGWQ
ncbi:hypothetical protein LAZ67_X003518 [Cordylochernes scorpioides]|uniref:Integrase catalytic domain-containing protein n=1 Tax=Cordylochernes scorpioides TaxID=51811 RepID=A0ABY6LU62_9ARAC|nr:hypothetical protein LAZ67_X003518 [Cordylochernes scorpioides]